MNHEAQSRFSVRAVAIVLASFAFATVFCVNLFPHYRNPNELSRFDLVVSIVDRWSLSIGPELAKFGYHEDRSVFRGEFFSNKAPGLSFAAVPAYALVRLFTGPASETTLVPILFVIRLLTVSSIGVFALLVFSRRLRRSRMDPRWIPSVVFALAFGTPWLVYSRSFFSHAWTAALLYLAFECLHRPEEKPWHPALAGFLAGWAVLSEYPAAIVAMLLLVDATWRRPLRRGAAFVAGAIPTAIALGLYDAACFAGPFDLSSAHEWYRPFARLSRGRVFGFSMPSPKTALWFLVSPSRGVLFQSPFFLFLPGALVGKMRDRAVRISIGSVAALFVSMCAYENWHGGWALGARYLLPVILLAAWPLAFAARDGKAARVLFAAAAVYGSIFFLFSGATFWFYPADPFNGPRFFTAWWLAHGWFVPTLVGSTLAGVLVLGAATAVAGIAALRPLLRNREEAVLAVLAGAVAFALLFAGKPPRGSFDDRLTRVRILESFTTLDPGRAELLRLGAEAKTPSDRQAWERTVAHYAARP